MDAAVHPTAETGAAATSPMAPRDQERAGSHGEPHAELHVEDIGRRTDRACETNPLAASAVGKGGT